MMILALSGAVVVVLLTVIAFLQWKYRCLRRDADGIVLRYVRLAECYEALVRDVTEPYGGVLSCLEDVNRLSTCLPCLPDKERATAQVAINCLEQWLRLLLCPVADRYHLSAEDKQRWLGDGVGLEVRE